MNEEAWVRFRYADAFPRSEPLGNWVACLALIANDLVHTNARLIELFETKGRDAPEALYYFWLSSAHYREAAKFLGETLDRPEVDGFVASLPDKAQDLLDAVRSTFVPWEGSFVKEVAKPLRDAFFHYPGPESDEWAAVWGSLSVAEGGVRRTGSEVKDARFVFGDDIRVSLMSRHLGESLEAVGENLRVLSDVIGKLAVFAQHALVEYLSPLAPDRLVQGKPRDIKADGKP